MKPKMTDLLDEDVDFVDLSEIDELNNTDDIEQYYDDYVSYERDLTQLIKERK